MKYLKITAKYSLNGKDEVTSATVPYVLETSYDLPDVYPFNQNIYFGPDDGAYLGRVYINKNGDIDYLADIIKLKGDKATYAPTRSGRYLFEFEIIEQ